MRATPPPRPADLDARAAECGNDKPRDDRRVEAALGRDAARDRERDSEGECHDAHDDARAKVGDEVFAGVAPEGGPKFRDERFQASPPAERAGGNLNQKGVGPPPAPARTIRLAGEPEQVIERERPGSRQGQRERGDAEHEVVLVSAVLHEEPFRAVHLGDRDRHGPEHHQTRQRREQAKQVQQPRGELPADRQGGPEPRRAEAQAADEPRGAREARSAERPERLLRAVAQEHQPQRQPERQQSKIRKHGPTSAQYYLDIEILYFDTPGNNSPRGEGSCGRMKRPSPAGQDVPLELWVVLARAFDAVERHSRASITRFGLGATEFGVLEVLYHKGELPVCEVQRRILVESSSTTYVVDKLVARGLVRRRPGQEDRREVLLTLKPPERRLIARIFPSHAAAMRRAVSGLSPRWQAQALDLLRRLGLDAARRLHHKGDLP